MTARQWCAALVGRRWCHANDEPSSALDIELGDHRHAGPVAVTPRASSAQLAGTPLRGLPPAIFAGTRRAGARPRVPLLPRNPRRRVVHRARRPTIVRRPPPSPLAGPLRPAASPLASASAAGEDSWCEHGARRGGWRWYVRAGRWSGGFVLLGSVVAQPIAIRPKRSVYRQPDLCSY